MKVRFILNPSAGRSGRLNALAGAVRKLFRAEEGIFEIKLSTDAESVKVLSQEAVRKGYELVFACGGDGTVNNVASSLVGTGTALGILPTGSGNALAGALGIPADVEAALSLVKDGAIREMDVGVACGRYFFSTAGFAFEAYLSRRYNEGRLSRRIRGVAPYFPLALMEYFRFKPRDISLRVDGQEINGKPFILTAANTDRFGGNAVISPDARMDDGLLDFCFIPRPKIFNTLGLGLKLLRGRIEDHKGFRSFRGSRGVIKGWDLVDAHVDGEPFQWQGDIEISVLHRKLKVLAPEIVL
ncbi:MAG: hypothetical protein A2V21_309510 [Deltaproteobacteria bacterium GWC2_55_46]|nr:MAG: hypothetical protein A2Z79_03610 [Deltaproteobacteria bacterium GWA2_55_82]OGQ63636.1 MAG: hypothetical protein A3I81_02710 [Deltaproteobacteria bacterium RIFCSPLOWO2_02_FULL_55_12]OIJ74471.1 MAG: hypothetical protein A2V21_309510 [Deltaproteobacteria bacterium GWC2_55_46]